MNPPPSFFSTIFSFVCDKNDKNDKNDKHNKNVIKMIKMKLKNK